LRSVSLKSRDVGDVDIVVNNAGYFPNRSIDELDLPTGGGRRLRIWTHTLKREILPARNEKEEVGRFVGISSNMIAWAIPGMSTTIATRWESLGSMRGWRMMLRAMHHCKRGPAWPHEEQWLLRLSRTSKTGHLDSRQSNAGEPRCDWGGSVLTSDMPRSSQGRPFCGRGGQYRIG